MLTLEFSKEDEPIIYHVPSGDWVRLKVVDVRSARGKKKVRLGIMATRDAWGFHRNVKMMERKHAEHEAERQRALQGLWWYI